MKRHHRKPPGIIYGVDEDAPLGVTVLSGLQHVGLMSVYLLYPILIAEAAGAGTAVAAALVSATLVALAFGTVLQTRRTGPFGSGYLCQPIPSVLYLVPSITAAKHGGLGMVFAMTLFAGFLELALAGLLRRLRPLFPPEVAGLVVLLAGIATGVIGLRMMFGPSNGGATDPIGVVIALVTLALMVALNVWGTKALRLFCVLIGMVAGALVASLLGLIDGAGMARLHETPFVALPSFAHLDWDFETTLVLPFVVAAVAASLKVIGNVTTSQKANDADWVRADMSSIGRGVAADGLGSIAAGLIGAPGINSSTGAVGLATATGVMSRRVAYAVAAILLVLALVPKLGILFSLIPRPVAGAALLFSAAFIVINGLQIMTSRLLDVRRSLVIGLALIFAVAVEIYPDLFAGVLPGTRTAFGASLVLGTLLALALNGVFRVGLRRRGTMRVAPKDIDPVAFQEWMEGLGASWGARREVIERASFNVAQSIETIGASGVAGDALEVSASFDEFRLDVRVSYQGQVLEFPERRPTNDEIIASPEGERRLAGYMLRRLADRVSASQKDGYSTILFHFDH